MEHEDVDAAIRKLAAVAELLATHGVADEQLRAFFLMQRSALSPGKRQTKDDELFKATASAALDMAGRKEYLAAAALLEQARSLL